MSKGGKASLRARDVPPCSVPGPTASDRPSVRCPFLLYTSTTILRQTKNFNTILRTVVSFDNLIGLFHIHMIGDGALAGIIFGGLAALIFGPLAIFWILNYFCGLCSLIRRQRDLLIARGVYDETGSLIPKC